MAAPLTPDEVAVLVNMIEDQRKEIELLRSNQPLLEVLRELARDPSVPPHVRLKAAEVGVGYETPKLSATVGLTGQLSGIGDQLDRARQRRLELRVIEGEGA